jgi:hypothetical protein
MLEPLGLLVSVFCFDVPLQATMAKEARGMAPSRMNEVISFLIKFTFYSAIV